MVCVFCVRNEERRKSERTQLPILVMSSLISDRRDKTWFAYLSDHWLHGKRRTRTREREEKKRENNNDTVVHRDKRLFFSSQRDSLVNAKTFDSSALNMSSASEQNDEANSLLLTEPKTQKTLLHGHSFGFGSVQGWRKSNEDYHRHLVPVDDQAWKLWSYFAIFDGHNGLIISNETSRSLTLISCRNWHGEKCFGITRQTSDRCSEWHCTETIGCSSPNSFISIKSQRSHSCDQTNVSSLGQRTRRISQWPEWLCLCAYLCRCCSTAMISSLQFPF